MIEMKSTKAEFNNCISIDFLSNFCYGGTEIIVSEMQIWGEVGESHWLIFRALTKRFQNLYTGIDESSNLYKILMQ